LTDFGLCKSCEIGIATVFPFSGHVHVTVTVIDYACDFDFVSCTVDVYVFDSLEKKNTVQMTTKDFAVLFFFFFQILHP
jgi:hypothetical protein